MSFTLFSKHIAGWSGTYIKRVVYDQGIPLVFL